MSNIAGNARTPRPSFLPLALLLCLLSPTSAATSFTTFEPRSMAMGSSGVAGGHAYDAPVLNPALVTNIQDRQKSNFARVAFGVLINDRNEFIDSLDNYKANDSEDAFSDALENFNTQARQGTLTLEDYTAILDSTENLLADIVALSDRPLRADAGGNATFGHSNEEYGGAVFARQMTIGGSIIRISDEDIEGIQSMLNALRTLEDAVRNDEVPPDFELPDPVEDFTSDVAVEAGLIREYGVTLGWRPNAAAWRFGMTLKRIEFETYDYVLPIANARGTSFRWSEHKHEERFSNVDMGASWTGGPWQFGLAVRNLHRRNIETVRGSEIRVRPEARAGVALQTRRYLLTADVDLTRNHSIGFDPDSQFISLGAEMKTWGTSAFRAGFQHNLASGENSPSIGFGIGPPQAHADLAFIDWQGQQAFAMQLGFQF